MRINKGELHVAGNVYPIEAPVLETRLKRSRIYGSDSVVYKSFLVDSIVLHSVVADSRLLRSTLRDGVVAQQATIADSVFELGSFVSGMVIGVYGRGVTVYDSVVLGVELDFGTHISDGVWMRKPERFTHPDIPYDITEGVEDKVIIGCWDRSVAQWLETTPEAYERIGINRQQYEIYKEAIIEMGAKKAENPSPLSLKRRK